MRLKRTEFYTASMILHFLLVFVCGEFPAAKQNNFK